MHLKRHRDIFLIVHSLFVDFPDKACFHHTLGQRILKPAWCMRKWIRLPLLNKNLKFFFQYKNLKGFILKPAQWYWSKRCQRQSAHAFGSLLELPLSELDLHRMQMKVWMFDIDSVQEWFMWLLLPHPGDEMEGKTAEILIYGGLSFHGLV